MGYGLQIKPHDIPQPFKKEKQQRQNHCIPSPGLLLFFGAPPNKTPTSPSMPPVACDHVAHLGRARTRLERLRNGPISSWIHRRCEQAGEPRVPLDGTTGLPAGRRYKRVNRPVGMKYDEVRSLCGRSLIIIDMACGDIRDIGPKLQGFSSSTRCCAVCVWRERATKEAQRSRTCTWL